MPKKPRDDFWTEKAEELLRSLWKLQRDKPFIQAELKKLTGKDYSLSAIAGKASRMDLARRPLGWRAGDKKHRKVKITLAGKA